MLSGLLHQFPSVGEEGDDDEGGSSISMGGAAAVLGGLLGYAGQKDTNSQNLQLGREQMQFQKEMSGTAYQRAVADMRQAGINPMLAAQVGGASSPSGSLPVMQNALGAGVSSANQAMQTVAAGQQIERSRADTENVRAQTDKVRSETMEKNLNTAYLQSKLSESSESAKRTRMEARESEERIPGVSADSYRKWWESGYKGPSMSDVAPDSSSAFAADVRRRRAEALQAELGIPQARVGSEFYSSDLGGFSPYVRQILEIVRGVTSAARAAR